MSNIVNTKTVIIGAGVSGISTAVNLLKKNYNDLLIFEALDRIGGRVNTIDYGDSFLEIGAQVKIIIYLWLKILYITMLYYV
jgi:monoamine oxidase